MSERAGKGRSNCGAGPGGVKSVASFHLDVAIGFIGMTRSISLNLDELQAAKTAQDVQRLFVSRLQTAEQTHETAIRKSIATRVLAFPADLETQLGKGGSAVGIDPFSAKSWSVVLANADGRPRRIRFADGSIVGLDYDYVVKAFLFCYFAVSNKPHSPTVATSILALVSAIPAGPLPFQDNLWAYAWHADQALAGSVFADIVDFVVLHEAGHIYLDHHDSGFLQMVVVDPARAAEGAKAVFGTGCTVTEFSVGTQRRSLWQQVALPGRDPRLILPGSDASERDEYAPDIFALLTRYVLDSEGMPDPQLVHRVTPARMLLWNLLFVYEAVVEESMGAGITHQDMLEIKRRDAGRQRTHPHAHSRVSVLHFHIADLMRRLDISGADTVMSQCTDIYDLLWADRFWTGVYLAANACGKPSEDAESAEWVRAFDAMDVRFGSTHKALRPSLKCLVIKSYGELCGLVTAVAQRLVPQERFASFERQTGERIIRGVAGDKQFGDHLAPLARAITDMPKSGG